MNKKKIKEEWFASLKFLMNHINMINCEAKEYHPSPDDDGDQ